MMQNSSGRNLTRVSVHHQAKIAYTSQHYGQFGCGILKMVGTKMQAFCPGNHCILRIRGVPVRKKLGMILENKVVQSYEKNVFFTKNGVLN